MRQGKKTASYECVVCAIKSFVDKILMATAFSLSSSRFIYLSLVAVAFDATKRSAWPAYCAHFLFRFHFYSRKLRGRNNIKMMPYGILCLLVF